MIGGGRISGFSNSIFGTPLGRFMMGSRDTTGVYLRRNWRFLNVTRPDPSILMMY